MAVKSKKPKQGRPPKPPGEKHPVVSTTVPPAVAAWLRAVGDDSISRGLRRVVVRIFESENATIPSKS